MSTGAGIAITLDKSRTLRFGFDAFTKYSGRVGGRGAFEIWGRLIAQDPTVLLHGLSTGLAHEEKELETNLVKVTRLIETANKNGVAFPDMYDAVIKALRDGGHLPATEEEGAATAATP